MIKYVFFFYKKIVLKEVSFTSTNTIYYRPKKTTGRLVVFSYKACNSLFIFSCYTNNIDISKRKLRRKNKK